MARSVPKNKIDKNRCSRSVPANLEVEAASRDNRDLESLPRVAGFACQKGSGIRLSSSLDDSGVALSPVIPLIGI
jgi:hypothetical protein